MKVAGAPSELLRDVRAAHGIKPSFNEATAGTNSAAQHGQPARVTKCLSFRRRIVVS